MAQTDRDGGSTTPDSPPTAFTWRGTWVTGTDYSRYDVLYYSGSSYIVLAAHTSGVFATDLAALKLELMAAKGTAGAGTGDMLAANNLIEVNPVLARNNLNAALEDSEGAAVAAAATTDIWASDGNTRHIIGNTTITSFGTAPQAGARMKLIFDGTPQLTQSSDLNLNAGGNNIQIEVGDWAEVYADTTTQFDVVVHRKSGQAIVAPAATGVPAGSVIDFAGAVAQTPSGYLPCDGAAVSRTTYADLFAAIGVLWGAGNGTTTFNVPNFAAGEAAVQNNGTVGASTVGEVITHSHSLSSANVVSFIGGANNLRGTNSSFSTASTTDATGGTKNLAAGRYVLKIIKT